MMTRTDHKWRPLMFARTQNKALLVECSRCRKVMYEWQVDKDRSWCEPERGEPLPRMREAA